MHVILHGPELRGKDVPVHLDLLLALLHRHLQLELAVLQAEHLVRPQVEHVPQPLHLELQHVVRDHLVLLVADRGLDAACRGLALQIELRDARIELARFLGGAHVAAARGREVVLGALDLGEQHRVLARHLLESAREGVDLDVQLPLLLVAPLAAGARNLALHLLDLELRRVEQLLLLDDLRVERADLEREVLVLALTPRDLGDEVALGRPERKELLAGFEHAVLESDDLLLRGLEPVLLLVLQPRELILPFLEGVELRELPLELALDPRELLPDVLEVALLRLHLLRRGLVARALHRELVGSLGQRVLDDLDLVLHLAQLLLLALELPLEHHLPALGDGDLRVELAVVRHLVVQELRRVVERHLLLAQLELALRERLARALDALIALAHGVHRLVPLAHELLALPMQLAEVLRSLVQLDLRALRLCDLGLEVVLLARDLLGHLLDVEVQLLDARLVRPLVLEQSQIVLLLLPRGQRPLLQLLLVPVHEELELVHLLVPAVHLVLERVHLLQELRLLLLQLEHIPPEPARLALHELLEVVLRLDLLVL
mmetsp:Transcript_5315/g.17663  ORF Transcript_5315/g.17663 Transcript_5315/m.17663 type:complete len:548 (-) Transcript_5315:704-2347(-)